MVFVHKGRRDFISMINEERLQSCLNVFREKRVFDNYMAKDYWYTKVWWWFWSGFRRFGLVSDVWCGRNDNLINDLGQKKFISIFDRDVLNHVESAINLMICGPIIYDGHRARHTQRASFLIAACYIFLQTFTMKTAFE